MYVHESSVGYTLYIQNNTYANQVLEEREAEASGAVVDKPYDSSLHDYLEKVIASIPELKEYEANGGGIGVVILPESASSTLKDAVSQTTDKMLEDWEKRLSMRSIKDVYSFIEEYLREDDVAPESMQLWEDDVNIISEESLGSLFNIERAIYIDTPMALNAKNLADNVFLQRLHSNMTHSLGRTLDKSKMLLLRIARLLNGKISQSDSLLGETELYYERKDEHLKLPVEKIATGMKTFAYLYQLIKNGYLDDKTILMIDEPEVHLHPQWIVEYARLLVLIHKTLGTKLILASHDPDFIAAIKAIAKREEVLEETNFYISSSEEQECSYRYNFKWLGKDIEPIFESFNIALERIQQYGDTDI